jgi:arylsulfatase A-like enzyme
VDAVVTRMQKDDSFDRTTLVVLSDHGFRFGGRDKDPRHIPFIVKEAGQRAGDQDVEPHQAAELLRNLVADSCK